MVLDEIVRTRTDIVDYNTPFRGSLRKSTREGRLNLEDVRKMMARFVGVDTILVGHGLENDFASHQLVHHKVVDTVMLYPHARGFPLSHLSAGPHSQVLGKIIQNGTSLGHSSLEDAKMSLELVRHKMVNDPISPFASEEASGRWQRKGGESNCGGRRRRSKPVGRSPPAKPVPVRSSLFGASLANESARSVFRR